MNRTLIRAEPQRDGGVWEVVYTTQVVEGCMRTTTHFQIVHWITWE